MSIVFEWHPAKEASNLRKHGVAFAEAATVFANPLARIFDDPDRSEAEEREVIVGHSAAPAFAGGILHGEARLDPDDQREKSHQA